MRAIDNWSGAFRTAIPWVVVTAVVMIPLAFLHHYLSTKPSGLLLEILAIGALSVPFILPFASGFHHRSLKVAVVTAILGIAIGCAVFAMILVLSFGGGGPFF
jgi:hypothetical protein